MTGTSMATPFVSAVLMAIEPEPLSDISRMSDGIRILDLEEQPEATLEITDLTIIPSEFEKGELVSISYEISNPSGTDVTIGFMIADDIYGTNQYGLGSSIDESLIWDTGAVPDIPAMEVGYHVLIMYVYEVGGTKSDSYSVAYRITAVQEEPPIEDPESGIAVAGTVLEDGNACSGCRVLLTYNRSVRYETQTEADGSFEIRIRNGNPGAYLSVAVLGSISSRYSIEYHTYEYED